MPVSRCPPPPFPVHRTCPTALPTNGRVVSWAYASASRWPRPSWWLPKPVSFLVLLPPSTPWPSSSGSGSALIGQVEVIGRSVVTPRHGRGHGPGYRACCARGHTPLPYKYSSENVIIAAHELAHALKNPSPQAPFFNIGDSQMVAIDQLSQIFYKVVENVKKIADPPQQQTVKNPPLYLRNCIQIGSNLFPQYIPMS